MTYDVAIIGGGLAGCSAAIRLAQQGYHVVLCEASTYPHHKVCGEFMSPGCRDQLAALGMAERVQQAGATSIRHSLISTPDGTQWHAELPGAAIGISRYVLDDMLADRCREVGVNVRTQTTVTQVEGSLTDGFVLYTRRSRQRDTIHARAVIGAYGKRSSIDRALKRDFLQTRQPFIGLKQHMRGVPIPDCVELHTFDGGYCGMSEIEDGRTNVCLLVREDVFREQGQGSTDAFIAWMQQQNPRIAERLADAEPLFDRWLSCAQVPFMSKSLVQDDILMTGDAAGMITPLTGDGMEMALQSGELAATHIAQYFDDGQQPQQLITAYPQAWQTTFGRRVQMGRVSQFVMLRPAWLRWGLRVFHHVPPLGDFFIHQTRHVESSSA